MQSLHGCIELCRPRLDPFPSEIGEVGDKLGKPKLNQADESLLSGMGLYFPTTKKTYSSHCSSVLLHSDGDISEMKRTIRDLVVTKRSRCLWHFRLSWNILKRGKHAIFDFLAIPRKLKVIRHGLVAKLPDCWCRFVYLRGSIEYVKSNGSSYVLYYGLVVAWGPPPSYCWGFMRTHG